ncbi:hypothetical protein [Alteriqipengyuania lutimaris]|uniref:Uncharacterized protein n=1 Tax=Alteriqipengyuania lutimaris TaxID=1538146 RepID=A0A395LJ89_9SPHN|nr:hypothetical protein [Alteriqipengyuania lutimaris]MBB3034026.1 pentapeptide MXKDX repeat protein [Alteriqipengyuania lutimaris]RDS77028.1 hypothetical protein DL238_04985 [Alteriqipengyuania lutimaris]
MAEEPSNKAKAIGCAVGVIIAATLLAATLRGIWNTPEDRLLARYSDDRRGETSTTEGMIVDDTMAEDTMAEDAMAEDAIVDDKMIEDTVVDEAMTEIVRMEREGELTERIFEALPVRESEFNQLQTVRYNQPETVRLVLNPQGEKFQELIGLSGKKVSRADPMANLVEVELTTGDSDVSIAPDRARRVTVLPNRSTTVEWSVRAERTEDFTLRLIARNIIDYGGRSIPDEDRKIYEKPMQVEVTNVDLLHHYVTSPATIWGFIGVLIALIALAWTIHHGRKTTRDKQDG